MGEVAEMMLDGILDSNGEYNEYNRLIGGWSESKRTRKIRKELAKLIKAKHAHCITEKQRNAAVNEARAEINAKYGHGWRGF